MEQSRAQRLRDRLAVEPETYAQIAFAALAALTIIVFTGAAVRVTGSGLGCPEWPKCETTSLTPTDAHAPVFIEFGNRMLDLPGDGCDAGGARLRLVAPALPPRPLPPGG